MPVTRAMRRTATYRLRRDDRQLDRLSQHGTALNNFYRLEGREIGEATEIWCVAKRLAVNYLAPTPIDQEVGLRATIEECTEKKAIIKCHVYSGGIATAEGDVTAVGSP
jgi:acyl-CoA thioesterase FadM